MAKKYTFEIITAFLVFVFLSVPVNAQMTSNVVNAKVEQAKENERLEFSVELFQSDNVSRVLLAYKTFNSSDFEKREMSLVAKKAVIQLSADQVTPPSIEYYIIIEYAAGQAETYPIGYPERGNPLVVSVEAQSQKEEEIILLSPEKDEMVIQNQFFIALSLLRAPDNVNRASAKIYLDGTDVTGKASVTEDLITIDASALEGMQLGEHALKIEIRDNENKPYYSLNRRFRCVSESFALEAGKRLEYHADLQSESRNEMMNKSSVWYNNLTVNANASYGSWALNGNAYLTSEEKKYLQPNNRFFVSLESDWVKLGFGDSYPEISNLILNGKRVRGFSGSIDLGAFSLQAAFGEVTRGLQGKVVETYSAAPKSGGFDIISIDSAKYGNPYGKVEYGTYKRNIVSVRPSLNIGDNFRFGLSYLHGKDDTKSIEFGRTPAENLVLGSDMLIGIDDQKILFTAQGAFSVQNTNISGGTLSDADIDTMFKDDADQIKQLKNIASRFITINQHIKPLNPQQMATLAAEAAFSLNYFGNYLKAGYIYHGNDYESFGLSYIRKDIAGFNIIDRIRLLDNTVYLSAGYESLSDNLQKTRLSTTNFRNVNLSGTYFPKNDMPSVTVGYASYSSNNGLPNISDRAVDDITKRYSVQLGYDVMYKVKHRTSLSLSNMKKSDMTIKKLDAVNTSVNASVSSQWAKDMNSYVNLGINRSRVSGSGINYFSAAFGGTYTMLEEKLELSSYINTSFGDYSQKSVDLNARYFVVRNFSIQMQLRYINYSGSFSNSIYGLMSRYEF